MDQPLMRTAKEIQQEFAFCYGSESRVTWDFYSPDDKIVLQSKLEQLVPVNIIDVEGILNRTDIRPTEKVKLANDLLDKYEKENKKLKEYREIILNAVWEQRKYCDNNLLMSIVFVVVTPLQDNIRNGLNSTTFTSHFLLRVRKCRVADNSENCCMIFVDECGRVYQNWDDYLENNSLPKGILIAPTKGVYTFDENDNVNLHVTTTPASSLTNQILRVTDVGAGALGLTAAVVPLGALVLPVAAPILAGTAVIGAAVGLWSTGRSTAQLVDRSKHEQSINVTDRQARSSWLGIAGGVLGLGASGASQGLIQYVSRGNDVSRMTQIAVDAVNIASMTVNGISVCNGVVELYIKRKDDEEITLLDFVQLSASLVLFTHSLYNFNYASNIVNATRDGKIGQFRSELSSRQRKMFDKMAKETIRIKGENQGKIDIIRAMRSIPDATYFNNLYKINSELNKQNVRPSFSPDGSVLLNNDLSIDPVTLRQNIQDQSDILGNVAPFPSTTSSPNVFSFTTRPNIPIKIIEIAGNIMSSYRILNEADLKSCISNMLEAMTDEGLSELIRIIGRFVQQYVGEIERSLNRFVPFEELLWRGFQIILRIQDSGGPISECCVRIRARDIIKMLKDYYEQLIMPTGDMILCQKCKGYYSLVANSNNNRNIPAS